MAVLTVQSATRGGLISSFVGADVAGDSFPNDGHTVLRVKNGSAASITVTLNSARPCSQGFDHDEPVSVPAGAEPDIGPFPTDRWNDVNGRMNVSYSAVTSVTVKAVRVV